MKSYEIRLGDLILNTENRLLQRADGERVELRNKSMDVLLALAEVPGEVMSKDMLLNNVWGETTIAEEGLVQCIADIRRALDDDNKVIVETIPRSGYRLNATAPAPPRPLVFPVIAIGLAAIAFVVVWMFFGAQTTTRSDIPTVAVLPLDDLSAADHQGHLSDALSEGIIAELARFPQFKVIARNSSFQFRGTPTDVRKIGETLGADYVVEGSQQYDGENLRVTIQLIETDTGTHVLSEKMDRKIDDLFAIQDQIVDLVASKIGGAVLTHIPTKRSKNEVGSLLRSLQARRLMRNFSRENWEKALALEETNIRTDPDSSWGYIGKALMLRNGIILKWIDRPRDEVLNEALSLSQKALTIAPNNYMSHFAVARVLATQLEYEQSILHYERASKLNPSDPLVLIGKSLPLLNLDKAEQAIETLLKAKAMDSSHGDWLRVQLGWAYWQNHECEKGLETMRSMSSPHYSSKTFLAAIYSCLGDLEKAKEAMDVYLKNVPDRTLSIETERVNLQWKHKDISKRWMNDMKLSGMPE